MFREFAKFLKEFNIVSLAVAFILGSASTSLINSLVKDVLMPIAEPFMSTESWRTAALHLGPVKIIYGSFLAELVNFIILALIVFIVIRKILKIESVKNK